MVPENPIDKTVVLSQNSPAQDDQDLTDDQNAYLIIIRGVPQGKRFELTKRRMFIGRDPSAEIYIEDPNASRKHAEVIVEEKKVHLRDNQSTNGTFVNDEMIQGTVALHKEDMIKIGSTIFKYLPAGELEIYYIGTLESAAHTDPLTKVYNRGYVMESFEAEFKRARALHEEFSIIVFDVDHFKKINDQYGHAAGDLVLQQICEVIKQKTLPKKSVFGRYGGEEFIVLLPQVDLSVARTLAEKMRKEIEKHAFEYEKKRINVTSSFGVAELALDVDSSAAMFKLADKALYEAKAKGRNQVQIAH